MRAGIDPRPVDRVLQYLFALSMCWWGVGLTPWVTGLLVRGAGAATGGQVGL